MEFKGIHFISNEKVAEFEAHVSEVERNVSGFCSIVVSEAYEQLGVAQFYNGKLKESLLNLIKSLASPFEEIRYNMKQYHAICKIKLLV